MNGSFNSIRRQAVKQGLANILGASGAASVIVNFSLDAYEDNPAAFHRNLYDLFKDPGTEVLEKSIIMELYSQLGDRFESHGNFDYAAQMDFAKKIYLIKAVK